MQVTRRSIVRRLGELIDPNTRVVLEAIGWMLKLVSQPLIDQRNRFGSASHFGCLLIDVGPDADRHDKALIHISLGKQAFTP